MKNLPFFSAKYQQVLKNQSMRPKTCNKKRTLSIIDKNGEEVTSSLNKTTINIDRRTEYSKTYNLYNSVQTKGRPASSYGFKKGEDGPRRPFVDLQNVNNFKPKQDTIASTTKAFKIQPNRFNELI